MTHSPYVSAGIAAIAMVATLPGRSHGLGLVTEPLIGDLAVDRVAFATVGFWATLLGAAFCLPCGWLIDRLGVRTMLAVVMMPLGVVVLAIARLQSGSTTIGLPDTEALAAGRWATQLVPAELFWLVLLTRGLGQSALSVVSLALIGKVAGGKTGPVMGFYSFVTSLCFMAAFAGIKALFEQGNADWRTVWSSIGVTVLILGFLAGAFVRNPSPNLGSSESTTRTGHTLGFALRSPAFWVFALATSLYGLISAGVSLFNQSILQDRGFDRSVFLNITIVGPLVGLAANLLTGWLAGRIRLGLLLAVAMGILAASLFAFPMVTTLGEVYAYAVAMGVAGGMITVLFFTVWGQTFGTAHLGTIQGAAQLLTVLASATGPLVFAIAKRESESYLPVFQGLAWVSVGFAAVAAVTRLPRRAA